MKDEMGAGNSTRFFVVWQRIFIFFLFSMKPYAFLLFPVAVIYDAVTRFRNHLFDIGMKKSVRFDLPVINIGNLTVGGTGKTPHAAYILEWLSQKGVKAAVLSRGYGRRTKGFRLANSADTAQTLGDEPMQLYKSLGQKITVAVGEDRVLAIPSILLEVPDTKAIVLDDAFQHRYVNPSVNLLLCDYNRPFFNDWLLPMGLLRESRKGAKRADAIIVSKCPKNLNEQQKQEIKKEIAVYAAPNTPVFFSFISYETPLPVYENEKLPEFFNKVILFSGLANAKPFREVAEAQYTVLQHFDFPDHHQYSTADFAKIKQAYTQHADAQTIILCTEKDMVKLLDNAAALALKDLPIAYWPIRTKFFDAPAFGAFLEKKVY
jgi:tetraacyldisaccharide 4'-kinase